MTLEERIGTVVGYDEREHVARIRMERNRLTAGDSVVIEGDQGDRIEVLDITLRYEGSEPMGRLEEGDELLLDVPERVREGDDVIRVADPHTKPWKQENA